MPAGTRTLHSNPNGTSESRKTGQRWTWDRRSSQNHLPDEGPPSCWRAETSVQPQLPVPMEMVKNAVNWFEIPVADFERAKAFYSKIFESLVLST